jgi:hypothetical protein
MYVAVISKSYDIIKLLERHKYPTYILNQIIKDIENCPICLVVLTTKNIYPGKTCGHPVCHDCYTKIDICPICSVCDFK